MSTGRGIAIANIESVKHSIEKGSWIVAKGIRSTVRSSSGNKLMHECFVFGSDHEELAKAFALKLFGDSETLSSEVPPEMMKLIKRRRRATRQCPGRQSPRSPQSLASQQRAARPPTRAARTSSDARVAVPRWGMF